MRKVLSALWIFGLIFLLGCTERVAIINGVDEREANEIVVFLASKGLSAEKQAAPTGGAIGGGGGPALWNIYVPSDQMTNALSILNRNGLPRRQGQDLLQIFGESGLVPTDLQQKIRFQAGLAQQIANTIRQIDGVIDATVQLSFPQEEEAGPITAAVYVKHQGILDNPNSQLVTKIKQLVSGSVAGLKLENVTVISDRSRFTDVTLVGQKPVEEETDLVSIWGVLVSRQSIGLFRFYFFLFSLLIIVFIAALLWVLWRVMPLLEEKGGIAYLWQLKAPTKTEEAPPPENPENPGPPEE